MPDYTLHVISHTHWDREWYRTFQRFRIRLVDLIDHVLDILDTDPDFKYFNMDGQTIVLEDYLKIRPHQREKLTKYIREGRIIIGPWYQLNDEFLVSGESTIRSLLVGHRIAREYGPVMKVGYLPDQFGNISQMPQIFQGFGIDNAIMGRGYQLAGDRKMEFYWESPDGTKVLASLMAHWYNNAQHFPSDTDDALNYALDRKNRMMGISAVDQLLLMNGVDHLEAQPDVGNIIRRVSEKLQGDKLIHSTLPAYIDALREAVKKNKPKLETKVGELREDRGNNILAGTLSSRMYLKQANEASQTALEKYAEPISSFAYTLGAAYPADFLTYAWKLLMENHPHDSICGCSIDQVHREMVPRFQQVQQVAGEFTERALNSVAKNIKTDGESLVVFNTLNWSRTDKVHAIIDIPAGDLARDIPKIDPDRLVKTIKLLDENGEEVPYALINAKTTVKQYVDPHELPMVMYVRRFEIEFVAEDVPSCGYRTYRIEKGVPKRDWESKLASEAYWDNAIANEFVRLSVGAGSLILERLDEDESTADIYSNINTFEDVGDVGDEYNHVKPTDNLIVTSMDASPKVSLVSRSPISATYKLDMTLTLPKAATADNSARSECTVDCPVTSYLTVTKGVPRVDIKTVVDNRAKDHRLRVLFPSGISTDVTYAEGQFDVVERTIGMPVEWGNASPFFPQQRWMDVTDGDKGLCVINKGMPEFEVYQDEGRTVGLTLLRCVARLSGGADAPGAEMTPEAQCIGEYAFEYAIYPHVGDWQDAQVWKQAHQHNVPLITVQTGAHDGELPQMYSFIETSCAELVVSAVKKAEDSDLLVVRVYNTTPEEIKAASITVQGAKGAKLLNLNEEVIEDAKFADGTVVMDVGPKKIVTLGFEVK